ncbi:hypothetical protein A5747_13255 [Mycobacterium sp. IS-836]|uniref:hypothetical protein n=1 Tax=Mycobacterium sp. IS-836 TaxID=1834160 RepID=UPI0009701824|nr:hypothetical protein [Mycobacterium sp. IS-836]OMC55357.1 hypothetical protein A5747_13255 [Mycobacterium sp. IS-836]
MSFLTEALKFGPKVLDAAVGFLPAPVANTIRSARKAIVAVAGASLGVLAALDKLPLPPQVEGIVSVVSVVATGIVTYWTPNAS